MTEATPPAANLDSLISLFYSSQSELGKFTACDEKLCPKAYRRMLAHESHMTVTVESRHGCAVHVEVLQAERNETHYCRKIVLRRESDGRVVQYGIVRLALSSLQPEVRDEIMAQKIPLGRVLIQRDVLRQVQLLTLWEVSCGAELADLFETNVGHQTYGRTALIYCDGEPAVELLEIVAPEDAF